VSTFLLAAAFALAFAAVWIAPEANWPEALLLLLATVGTVIALARRLPLQNVLLASLITAGIGGAAHTLGVVTEMPFGPFTFTPAIGAQLFKTLPWAMPLVWVVVILNSRGVARLVLRPWRKIRTYGFWLIGLTAALTVLFDLAFDPFATRVKHYWFWLPTKFPLTWQGAPLTDFIGWATVSLLILAFITPALINKQPGRSNPPDFHPLVLWLGAILLFGTASALHALWLAAGADAVVFAVAAGFAIRGAKW
jgi:uncharacterized membrane protein